jgi:hypothetical protein
LQKQCLKSWRKANLVHVLDRQQFSERYEIVLNEVCGEAGDVYEGILAAWLA